MQLSDLRGCMAYGAVQPTGVGIGAVVGSVGPRRFGRLLGCVVRVCFFIGVRLPGCGMLVVHGMVRADLAGWAAADRQSSRIAPKHVTINDVIVTNM